MDIKRISELIVAELSPFHAVVGMEDYVQVYSTTAELRQELFPSSTKDRSDPLLVLVSELHVPGPIEEAVAKIRSWWDGEIEILIVYSLCTPDDLASLEADLNVSITTMLEPGTFWD